MTNIYDIIVDHLAGTIRTCFRYGDNIDINVSVYKEGDATITIHDEERSPHFYAVDIDEYGRIVQKWYRDNREDDWLFTE